jgi:hypothetical protein
MVYTFRATSYPTLLIHIESRNYHVRIPISWPMQSIQDLPHSRNNNSIKLTTLEALAAEVRHLNPELVHLFEKLS